jgi:hypothetical protein
LQAEKRKSPGTEGELPEGQERLAWATPWRFSKFDFFLATAVARTLRGFITS